MTTKISELLEAAARQAVPVVRDIGDGRLGAPTPCADYTVRDLLNHLLHVVIGFQALAARKEADFTTTPDHLARIGDGWRDAFAEETARLAEAWAAPGAEEGRTGAMDLPARTVGHMILLDLTTHPWDLARATGQDFTPDPGCVRELAAPVAEMAPMGRRYGAFGEPAPVPDGATDFEKLLALTGRDPGWTPPAGG
ncbi:TIGR03086 family protein [Streptomyces sp. F63]|uniref:TIGR03086 family metal-binding protein n=1 Tax=Streptomyces sp. F63 TaxID=2824887 RepID=UPI001B38CE26|nr:TIGR03086 family metal-binding protein [Streptomyces sp. F63]MBQ0983696.1 TIGR03086 family protein [Streptomyces sp. F63]